VHPVVLVGAAACVLRRRLAPDRPEPAGADAEPAEPEGRARWPSRPRQYHWTAAVLLVAWLPALIDQVNGTGNLGKLVRWARGHDTSHLATEVGHPLGQHTATWGSWLLNPLGWWAGRSRPWDAYGVPVLHENDAVLLLWLPAVLGATVAAALWLRRRAEPAGDPDEGADSGRDGGDGDRGDGGSDGGNDGNDGNRGGRTGDPVVALVVLAAAGVVATFAGLATMRGVPAAHSFRWSGAIVMATWIAGGWVAVRAVTPLGRVGRSAMPVLLLVATLVPVASALWRGTLGQQAGPPGGSPALLRLQPQVKAAAAHKGLVAVDAYNGFNAKNMGLAVILDRAGLPWVDATEHRAAGHFLLELSSKRTIDAYSSVDKRQITVIGSSGPARPEEAPTPEVFLLSGMTANATGTAR
jgi:hypothetical protein